MKKEKKPYLFTHRENDNYLKDQRTTNCLISKHWTRLQPRQKEETATEREHNLQSPETITRLSKSHLWIKIKGLTEVMNEGIIHTHHPSLSMLTVL